MYDGHINDTYINQIKLALTDEGWSNISKTNDVHTAYNLFIAKFSKIYDKYIPMKTTKIKQLKGMYKPWISNSILKSM